jgi:hypothetical protein
LKQRVFPAAESRERDSRWGRLAEGREPGSNLLTFKINALQDDDTEIEITEALALDRLSIDLATPTCIRCASASGR